MCRFCSFLFLFFICHSIISAQNKKSIADWIDDIESQSSYVFNYERDSLKSYFFNGSLTDVIDESLIKQLFLDSPYSFQLEGNTILVFRAPIALRKICGNILDKATQSPLAFANVHLLNLDDGVETDLLGRFEFSKNLSKNQQIRFSYLGYESQTFFVSEFGECRDIYLDPNEGFVLQDVVIRGYLQQDISEGDDFGSIHYNYNQFTRRRSNIEYDVLKTIQSLPGVVTADDSATKLNIRGSTPDQNLILWDDIPLYDPGHVFGMISSINPFVVDRVEIYRDAFDPRFDNRIGGLVNIGLPDRISSQNKYGVGTTLTEAHAYMQTELVDDLVSITASGRHSIHSIYESPTLRGYSNSVFQNTKVAEVQEEVMDGEAEANNSFNFSDFNFKTIFQPSDQFTLKASYFKSKNVFNYSSSNFEDELESFDAVDYSVEAFKIGGVINFSSNHSTNIFFKGSNSVNNFSSTLFNEEEAEIVNVRILNDIEDDYLEINHHINFSQFWEVDFGYNYNRKKVSFDFLEDNPEEGSLSDDEIISEQFHNSHFSLLGKGAKWSLQAGLKFSKYAQGGSGFWSPRMVVQLEVMPHLKWKASAGRMYQFINQVVEFGHFDLNLNGDIWTLRENDSEEFMRSDKVSSGFVFKKDNWLVDLSIYLNQSKGLTFFDRTMSEGLEFFEDDGVGQSKGVELLVSRRWGAFQSWINYTMSQNQYQFFGVQSGFFPASNDQRHVINWNNFLSLGDFRLNVTYQFKSGLPYSAPQGIELIDPEEEEFSIHYDGFNQQRLPNYQRLDLGVSYLKNLNKIKLEASLSVLNVWGSENVYGRSSFLDRNELEDLEIISVERRALARLPIAMIRVWW